jgi:hypothetical protein
VQYAAVFLTESSNCGATEPDTWMYMRAGACLPRFFNGQGTSTMLTIGSPNVSLSSWDTEDCSGQATSVHNTGINSCGFVLGFERQGIIQIVDEVSVPISAESNSLVYSYYGAADCNTPLLIIGYNPTYCNGLTLNTCNDANYTTSVYFNTNGDCSGTPSFEISLPLENSCGLGDGVYQKIQCLAGTVQPTYYIALYLTDSADCSNINEPDTWIYMQVGACVPTVLNGPGTSTKVTVTEGAFSATLTSWDSEDCTGLPTSEHSTSFLTCHNTVLGLQRQGRVLVFEGYETPISSNSGALVYTYYSTQNCNNLPQFIIGYNPNYCNGFTLNTCNDVNYTTTFYTSGTCSGTSFVLLQEPLEPTCTLGANGVYETIQCLHGSPQ